MKDINLMDVSREDWLKLRKKGLGGSDMAAVMKQSPFTTPLDVFLDKVGRSEPVEETARMRAGVYLEGAVANMFSDEHPEFRVVKDPYMRFHKKHDFLYANTDRIIKDAEGNNGVLEIKTTNSWYAKTWDADVPWGYYVQLQHYLGVLGFSYGYIAILIDGWDYRSFMYERDDELIKEIEQAGVKFWKNNVLKTEEPEAMTDDDIKKLWPQEEEGSVLEADMLDNLLCEEYIEAQQEESKWSSKKKELGLKLKKRMTSNESLVYGGMVLATLKKSSRGTRILSVKKGE